MGQTAALATKVVVSIVCDEGQDPDPLERWFSENTDVRNDPATGEKILAFLKEHGAKSVIATDGLIGCPHEEGIDYPPGKILPAVPLLGRARPLHARAHPLKPAHGACVFSWVAVQHLVWGEVSPKAPLFSGSHRESPQG
jgi:hypothetical protein